MFRRRRPLMRGAAVGAAGYAVGKRAARRREEEGYYDDAQDDSAAISDDQIESLRQLAQLKEQGILTDEEFEDQKERILQGG